MSSAMEIADFLKSLDDVQTQITDSLESRLWTFANMILTNSNMLCPVDTGALVGSGKVTTPEWQNGHLVCEIGYNTDYAAAVHERLDLHHAAPTQAKFLETAMRQLEPKFVSFMNQGT